MTPTELNRLICCMESKGGSFVSALAQALRYADPSNRTRILEAFPDIVQKYGSNGVFVSEQQTVKTFAS